MPASKPSPPVAPTRDRVLAAAERLLAEKGDFSMRDLAAAAGVSFATPFNQFGSKLAIMRALSAQRIETMHARASAAMPAADAAGRVLAVVAIAVSVMVAAPAVNRAVMGAIGAPGDAPGDVRDRSRSLWAMAIGDGAGLTEADRALGRAVLPDLLAAAFRGVLSFWTAGEIADAELEARAREAAAALLFGFVSGCRRDDIARLLHASR